MMSRQTVRTALVLVMLALTAQAQVGVQIGQHAYSVETVELLHRAAQRDNTQWSISNTLSLLIDNQLLADLAVEQFGEATLLQSEARVGFPDREVIAQQFLATTMYLFQSRQQNDDSAASYALPVSQPAWWACDRNTLIDRLALGTRQEFRLPDAALEKARNTPVLSATLAATHTVSITLAELYQQQNVQGRMALHNGDCAFLHTVAQSELSRRAWLYWLHHHSGVAPTTLKQLQHAIHTRYVKDQYFARLGIAADAHDDTAYLRDMAKTITAAEIAAYYAEHRDQFMRVTQARGRHIRVADEATADRLYTELANGLDFSLAMQRYSNAQNVDDVGADVIDWVINAPGVSWRDSLLLILPVNQPNRPLKVPQRDRWELIWVDERQQAPQEADSESVRYQVSAIVARQKVLTQLQTALVTRRQTTPIHVHAKWRQYDPLTNTMRLPHG